MSALSKRDGFFALAAWVALATFLAATFNRYFDFTDEGIYTYLLMHGKDAIFVSPFYTIFHYIGVLFDHSLIGYRWSSLVLISASTAYLSYNVATYFRVPPLILMGALLIASLFSYNFLVTLSYNNMTTIAALLWSGAFFAVSSGDTSRGRPIHLMVLVAAIFLAFLSRPPFGVILLFYTGIAALYQHRVLGMGPGFKSWLAVLVCTIVSLGAFALSHLDLVRQLAVLYPTSMATSHSNIIGRAIWDVSAAIVKPYPLYIVVVLCMLATFTKARLAFILRGLVLLIVGVYLASLAGLKLNATLGSVNLIGLAGLMLAANIVLLLTPFFVRIWPGKSRVADMLAEETLPRLLFLAGICCVVPIASNFGSNGNIMQGAVYVMPLMILLPLCFTIRAVQKQILPPIAARAVISMIAIFVALMLWKAFYIEPYRVLGWDQQTVQISDSPVLKKVYVDPEFAATITHLQASLETIHFDRQNDRILAYPDIPGVLAAVNARALGTSWVLTRYPDIDINNCAYMALEPTSPIRYVYVLRGGALSPELADCTIHKMTPADDFKSVPIGPLYHYRNQEQMDLVLEGPYLFPMRSK